MNKTSIKIFFCFTCFAALIATILLGINFIGFSTIGSDTRNNYETSPKRILNDIHSQLSASGDTLSLSNPSVLPDDSWCILIDENGDIIWSQNQPEDIPTHYSINDIAKMTKWFLNDYPVYVQTADTGLLVLGMPKNSVGKYDIEYSMKWFSTLPQRILAILILNLLLATILAFVLGGILFHRLSGITNGIKHLQQEKPVLLKEKGLFKELSKSINETSAAITRKNNALAQKDRARLNWIAGISHDIRTPLSLIMGNAESLECSADLSSDSKKKSAAILAQSLRIRTLVADLNLISSLEYDMQPSKKKEVRLCPFLRRITTDILNSGIKECFEIELDLKDEKSTVRIDESLIERAIYNLLHNSITHNPLGCHIKISSWQTADSAYINIRDNGTGVPEDVLQKINELPKTAHGLGLPMAYRIVAVHGGNMSVKNENGFAVTIRLPS